MLTKTTYHSYGKQNAFIFIDLISFQRIFHDVKYLNCVEKCILIQLCVVMKQKRVYGILIQPSHNELIQLLNYIPTKKNRFLLTFSFTKSSMSHKFYVALR